MPDVLAQDISTATPTSGATVLGVTKAGVVRRFPFNSLGPYINALDPQFGIVGDGFTDDSEGAAAFFSALNASGATGIIPADTDILVNATNLFLIGGASLLGENRQTSILRIGGSLPDSGKYWINLGIPSIGGTPAVWTGSIRNLKISCAADAGEFRYPVFMHYVDGCAITDNVFDWTPLSTGQTYPTASIEGFNNSLYSSANNHRKNIRIERNDTYALQDEDGGESYGCNFADKIFFIGNTSYGMADDFIGLHGCTDFTVINNRGYTTDGRIYIGSSQKGRVSGNYIERIAGGSSGAYYGNGSFITAEIENATALPQAPTDIQIHDNTFKIPAQTFANAIYGIYIRGGRDIDVKSNVVICDSSSTMAAGINLSEQTGLTGWTDPDGIDAGTVAKVRNVRVIANKCIGRYPQAITMGGTNTSFVNNEISGNRAKSYTTYWATLGDLKFYGNDTTDRDGTGLLAAAATQDTPELATMVYNAVAAGATVDALLFGSTSFTSFVAIKACRIAAFRHSLNTAITTQTITIEVSINGGAWATLETLGSGSGLQKQTSVRNNASYTLAAGDRVELRATAHASLTPTPVSIITTVLGWYA